MNIRGNKIGKVSVIIPAFNADKFINACIDSVLNQSYDDFEVIVVDDGSTDRTAIIAKEYARYYSNISYYRIENHGQGYARNYALKHANGEYILFLDSDDFIAPETLEKSVTLIEQSQADLVMFDWCYYNNRTKATIYNHSDKIFREKCLEDQDCLKILGISPYFTVNKLYRKSFLQDNSIEYGEGYIYEDVPFWTKVAVCARKISIIHHPLYFVRIATSSTTKTNYGTSYHYESYLTSVATTLNIASGSIYSSSDFCDLYKYLLVKFQQYRDKRIPKAYRRKFTKQFIALMKTTDIDPEQTTNKLLRYCYKYKVFKDERYLLFNGLVFLKQYVRARRHNKKTRIKKLRIALTNLKKWPASLIKKHPKTVVAKSEERKIVLFMGFDYRFTGNSRYLFEDLIMKSLGNIEVYFVTDDARCPYQYRIVPRSKQFAQIFDKANIVIFESWVPAYIRKRPGTIWLQLWHGTPLKKMLFDSNEKELLEKAPKHKANKYADLRRWDYLMVDCDMAQKLFHSAFMIANRKILVSGYPRVRYLIDNSKNEELKTEIKQKYDLPHDKKLVVYLPTWRDYNYGDGKDFDYLLDVERLQQELGDEYYCVMKDHVYHSKDKINVDVEVQELQLVADYIVTDYSSAMFDSFAIDTPVILYVNDFDKYQESRGVYPEIWADLSVFATDKLEKVVKMIKTYKIGKDYQNIKSKYTYTNRLACSLTDILVKAFNPEVASPFVKRCLIDIKRGIDDQQVLSAIKDATDSAFEVHIYCEREDVEKWKAVQAVRRVHPNSTARSEIEYDYSIQCVKVLREDKDNA